MLWFSWLMVKFNVATNTGEFVCPRVEKWFSEESYGFFGTVERRRGMQSRPFLLKSLSYGLGASSLFFFLFFFFDSKLCRIKGNGKEAFFCWMACNVGAARAVGAIVSVFFHKPLDAAADSCL